MKRSHASGGNPGERENGKTRPTGRLPQPLPEQPRNPMQTEHAAHDGVLSPSRRSMVAAWSTTALVAFAPFHAIGPDVGITLKPWIIALVVGLIAAGAALVTAFRSLSIWIRAAMILMGAGGIISIFVSADPARTFRHVAALGLAAAAILLVVAVKDIPFLGLAVRFGAIAMGLFALIEALLVMSSTAAVSTLEAGTAVSGSLAEVVYGDIIVVSGTHFDSNFASVYAATWAFLLFAYPAERFFNRWADGAILGLLIMQLVLTQSKTGTIGVIAAVLATMVVAIRLPVPFSAIKWRKSPLAASMA